MATIETKYVDVGFFDGGGKFSDQYGFTQPLSKGTLSNTANGASDPDVSGIYSGVDCIQIVWFDTNVIQFAVETVQSNSGWDSITIGSTTLSRSAAGFTTSSAGNGSTTWNWSGQSNPFGTTEGADVLVTWDDGAASIVPPVISSVTNNNASAANVTATVNLSSNGSGGTLQYAQTTANSVPSTGWQSSASFTHPRGTTRYYWASQATNTAGAFDDSGAIAVGYIAPDTAVSPVSTTITASATSASIVINNVTSGEEYQLRNLTGQVQYQSGTASGTSVTISQTGGLPTAGNTVTYSVYARRPTSIGGDNAYDATGDTYTIERSLAGVPTPTGFTVTDVVANGGTYTSSTSTTNNLAADALADHTLQFRVDSGTWSTTSSYTHNYGVQRVYEARYVRTADSAVSVTSASITRRVADAEITITPVTSILSTNTTNELKIADIGGATALTQYRARATGNINGSSVTNLFINAPTAGGANPDINAANPGELPAEGTSATYSINVRVTTANNGDNNYRQLRTGIANRSWVLSRTDGTPNAYTIPDVTNAALGAEQNVNVQISGITETVTASRTSGTATFAVSSTSTTPSAGSFSSTAKSITNNQYLHVKQDSSGTAGTTLNSGFSIGGVTDTFSNTTAGSGDITVTVVYDQESGTFLPEPGFSPVVSGQNGLSNAQARELTAGTDVVFQNLSDPGTFGVIVSGLTKFTNNNSFTLNQGQSVTRTWASGQLGNTVNTVTLTGQSATDFIYFKQPPVAPDTDVNPVSPANRAFNDTATFNVTVNNVTSGENYKITENNFTTSLGSATASGTSVTIPMTIGNAQANTYGNLAVGATKTYEIHASRSAALGGTGSFVQTNDTFTVTRNVESVSVPTDIVFSDPGTNDDNVNITVTASGGSGGTLQVSDDNTNWDANGTAYAAIRGTQGTYYARRLGSQGASVSTTRTENYTPPYRSPDSSITLSGTANNATITPGATANLTLTISNGGSLDEYRILTTDTNTPLASGTSVGSRTGNGNITISSGEQPDVQGTAAGYKVQVRRPTAAGGNNTFADTGNTFTITRQAISAPTDIVFGADPGTADELVSITATASGGANGTIQLSEVSNFATTVSNGSSFTFTRGTSKTIYARRIDGGVVSGTYSEAFTASYLSPDATITTIGTQDLATGSTSFNITIANGNSNTVYEVRSTGYTGTIEGSRTGNGTLTVSDAPAVGGTKTYYITAYRTVATGGNGSTRTNIQTFTAARDASAPTDIVFGADPGTRDELVLISCTASGGAGGNLEVSQDNTNWFNSPQNFTFTRGTPKTIYARRNSTGGVSTSYSESFTASYIAPDTTVALSIVSGSISPGHTANITANVSGGTQGDVVEIRTQDTNTPLASGASVGSATFNSSGNASITISSGEQPTLEATANTATYRCFVRTPSTSGGDNGYDTTSATDTITRQIHTNPTDIVFGADPGTADEIAAITCTASGGTYGTLQVSENNSTWFSNGSSFNFTRGTAKTIYARRLDGSVASGSYSESFTLAYLLPDLAVTPSSDTIAFDATSATTSLTNATAGETYAVRLNNGSTNLATRLGSGNITFTSSLPSVGNSTTYEIFARRPTTTGGDGSTYYATNDTFTVTRSVEPVTAPTDIVFSDPGTNDDNVNITVTASGGSGGTLKVSDDNVTFVANGSTFAFVRGTQRTIYARREGAGANSTSYSENYTPPYRSPDSNITVTPGATTISPGSTASVNVSITNAGTLDQYRILTTDTNTPLASGASVGSRTGSGNITLANGELPDVQGTSAGYKVQVRRPTASGGNNTYADTGDTFTISRQAISAPTDIVFGADPATASPTVSITATASGGANGTIQLSEVSNFASTVSNGSSFTFTRGIPKTIYARRIDGAVTSSTYSEANTPGFLQPDLAVAGSSSSITFNASSATTTVSGMARATDTVAVRLNNGSTNIATRDGNGDITFTSNLPAVGNTTTYELFTRRAVSTGGDGSTFFATNDTFTVQRLVEPVSAPTDIVFSDPGTNDDNVNITCTASGGSGGTLQVSQDNVNWVSNGSAFAFVRGTQRTIYARRSGAGNNSTSYSENYTPPYRAADATITLSGTANNATITPGATANLTLTISNGGNLDEYRILTTDTNTPLASGTSVGSRTGSGNITISSGEQPDVQGTAAGYKVQVRRPTATGGNNTFADTGNTFTISRQAISAPTDIVFGADPGTSSATVSITATASGGANGTIQLSEVSNFATTVSNGSSFTFTRGTSKTIYARRIDGAVTSSTYNEANTVGYLNPDLAVAGSSSSITFSASSATTSVTGMARATDTVAVRLNNGSTNIATRDGNGDITFSSNLPSVGNTTTYELFTRRAVSTGGDGSTFFATNDTFTVERLVEPVSAPTDIVFGADPGTEDELASITCTASGGSGGTLQVSEDNVNWFSNGSSFTFTRGTQKTIYARRAGAGNNSASYSENFTLGYLAPILSCSASNVTIVFNASDATTTLSNLVIGQRYAIRLNNGSTNLTLAKATQDPQAYTFSGSLPSVNNTTTYEVFVSRAVTAGGDDVLVQSNVTFTVTRASEIVTAPTDIALTGDTNSSSLTVNFSATATGGSGGTVKVSEDGVNFDANGTFYTFTRGTQKTIYARREGTGANSSQYTENFTIPFLLPDTDVAATSSNITFDATSATTTLSNATAGEVYAVRLENSGTNIVTRIGDGNLTFTTNLPAVGNTTTYEIYASRSSQLGGDGGFDATNNTFTVTRDAETVTAPTDIVFSDPGTNDDNVNITCTASGGAGGTIRLSTVANFATSQANGTTFAFVRGASQTIYARREGSGANSTNYSESFTPSFRSADANITATPAVTTISPGSTSTVNVSITGMTAIDEYRLLTTDTNTPQASGHVVDTGTGVTSDTFVIAANELPDVQGTSAGYKMQVRRPTAAGGNNTYADTGDTFTISRQAISAPTDIVFGADPGTSSATVSITATASGGANGTIQLSEVSNFATTVSNGSSFTFTRGTSKTIYARRIDGAVTSSTYNEANTVGYLNPDLAVAGSSSSITFNASSATTSVTGMARATDTVAVRLNNGSTNIATRDGNGDITFSSNLPAIGNTTTYELFTRRAVSTGGDGSTFFATNDTFTVTRNAETVTAPTDIAFGADPGTTPTITITATASGGSGGTLKVSEDNVNFDNNGTSYTFTRGTPKTIYARREGSGANSSTYSESYTAATFAIAAPASIDEGSAGTINVTTTNITGSTTLYWDLDSPTDYATSQGSVSIVSNAGSFTITPSADSQTEGAETDTIRLYFDSGRTLELASDSFTINDTSTGGSQGSEQGDGAGDYGLVIYGPDGSTVVFSSNFRASNNIITDYNVSVNAGASTTYTGIADANVSTKVGVRVTGISDNLDTATITRSTASGGTITVTNPTASTKVYDVFIYRIG